MVNAADLGECNLSYIDIKQHVAMVLSTTRGMDCCMQYMNEVRCLVMFQTWGSAGVG